MPERRGSRGRSSKFDPLIHALRFDAAGEVARLFRGFSRE
jgi:hypothetical protein